VRFLPAKAHNFTVMAKAALGQFDALTVSPILPGSIILRQI
jgi:hypothetical protein